MKRTALRAIDDSLDEDSANYKYRPPSKRARAVIDARVRNELSISAAPFAQDGMSAETAIHVTSSSSSGRVEIRPLLQNTRKAVTVCQRREMWTEWKLPLRFRDSRYHNMLGNCPSIERGEPALKDERRYVHRARNTAEKGRTKATLATACAAFEDATWPRHVMHICEQFNPDGIELPAVDPGCVCWCSTPCRITTCTNGKNSVFCTALNCKFGGDCSNAVREASGVKLGRDVVTKEYTVVATRRIEPGEIIGEYLGKWRLVPSKRSDREPNKGYALVMRQTPSAGSAWRVCVDASSCGGLMRHLNHSCRPTARFHAMSNQRAHTVAVAVIDTIPIGGEVTVDYGDDLWFRCRCGDEECVHRHVIEKEHAFVSKEIDIETSFVRTSSQCSSFHLESSQESIDYSS